MAELKWALDYIKNASNELKNNYIGGEWVRGGGPSYGSINPANNEVLGCFAAASVEDVDAAVKAARKALSGPWGKSITNRERGRMMMHLARDIEARRSKLATLETLDNGKLYTESLADVDSLVELLEYYAGWVDKHHGDVYPVPGQFLSYARKEPMGVCGQIIPWNFPIDMAAYKLAPALATGNTIVIKPSEITSFSLMYIMDIIHDSGLLPEGVLNMVLGGADIGEAMGRHMDIDKIAFTGSTAVGRKLLTYAAESNLKPVSLELGGKSPNIIFADAPDLDFAISRSFDIMFFGKGEKCSEPTRLFVERPVYEKVLSGLTEKYNKWKVGDPFNPAMHQGAQISQVHFDKIMGYIALGKEEGGKLLCGGDRNIEGDNAKGWFINPTIFYDCHNKMRIAQEEIFGPVLSVIPFDNEDEVVNMANDCAYGLGSGFWTNDVSRTQRVANAIKAGMVFINRYGCYDAASPFGGIKESGWGQELAKTSLDLYTRNKVVWYYY